MSEYRRYFVAGGTYFFTLVTRNRAPLFHQPTARNLLGSVMRRCFRRYPTQTIAIVLMPDHLHAIWSLPTGDAQYSERWRWIKREFTRTWLTIGGTEVDSPKSPHERRRNVWQRRFWEHTIRDISDLEAHFDYIHYNPVKHGLVERPSDWPWSSFHRWTARGHYDIDWGANSPPTRLPSDVGE